MRFKPHTTSTICSPDGHATPVCRLNIGGALSSTDIMAETANDKMNAKKIKGMLEVGRRVRVINKFNDEIADGFVTEIRSNGFQMESDGQDVHIAWRNVVLAQVTEVTLNVAS